MTHPTLADSLEAGAVEMQGILIERAFHELNPEPEYESPELAAWSERDGEFESKMHAHAYVDAAMMLVPEGWRSYSADMSIENRTCWVLAGPKKKWVTDEQEEIVPGDDWYQQGVAKTHALAIAAACVRAHSTDGEKSRG